MTTKINNRLEEPETRLIDTTVGRVIFNNALTERMRFYNLELDKGGVKDLVAEVYEICGQEETCIIADSIKEIGFYMQPALGQQLRLQISPFLPGKKKLFKRARIGRHHRPGFPSRF
jgi:DNA-directed RNA polymerase subunit beta'